MRMLAIMRCTAEAVTSPSFSFAYLHRCTLMRLA